MATTRVCATDAEQIRVAAQKSVDLLQSCDAEFFRRTGCIACHQQSITAIAVAHARKRGIPVDESTAEEQQNISSIVLRGLRDRSLQRVDDPFRQPITLGYYFLGLATQDHPPDLTTDALVIDMAGRQRIDGSWTAWAHRPPIEYSPISSTAFAVRSMQLYAPPGRRAQFSRRIDKARSWLVDSVPRGNEEDAFRLLGLVWSGAEASIVEAQVQALVEKQRENGGWSQLPGLESDAYATGLSLYALHVAGMATTHSSYNRGVEYLLRTQLEDGSWHVQSRSFPVQDYFESGFPHEHDQWISAAGTGWSAVALMNVLPVLPEEDE
jgi:hypothetical protein